MDRLLPLIFSLNDQVARLERWLTIVLAGTIATIIVAQVVLRYGFNAPLFWAEEVAAQLLVFMTLLGLSLLIHAERLIAIDFVPKLAGTRGRHVLAAAFGLSIIALLLFIAWLAYGWISQPQVRLEMSSTTRLPRWYNYAVLPVALGLMVLHQAVTVLKHLCVVSGGSRA